MLETICIFLRHVLFRCISKKQIYSLIMTGGIFWTLLYKKQTKKNHPLFYVKYLMNNQKFALTLMKHFKQNRTITVNTILVKV